MLRHERLGAMLEAVASSGTVTVEEVAARFGVSPATVRRDLDDLAAQQLLTRTRGGAVAHSVTYDLPLRYKTGRQSMQKQRIAAAAAQLVGAGEVVGFNGGTTTSEVARALAARADTDANGNSSRPSFTVVTNALNIANELAVRPHLKIVVVGGVLRPQSFELTGPFAAEVLGGVALDVMFLGVDAISLDQGAAAQNEGEAQINRAMLDRAARVIAVADGSKLGRHAFCTICELGKLDTLITDAAAPADLVRQLRDAGLEVLTA